MTNAAIKSAAPTPEALAHALDQLTEHAHQLRGAAAARGELALAAAFDHLLDTALREAEEDALREAGAELEHAAL